MPKAKNGEVEPRKANVSWKVIDRPATLSEFSTRKVLAIFPKRNIASDEELNLEYGSM